MPASKKKVRDNFNAVAHEPLLHREPLHLAATSVVLQNDQAKAASSCHSTGQMDLSGGDDQELYW